MKVALLLPLVLTSGATLRAAPDGPAPLRPVGMSPLCPVTPAQASGSLGPSKGKVVQVSAGTAYYQRPCFRYAVDVLAASDAGSQLPGVDRTLRFDSKTTERLEGEAACRSLAQHTQIFRHASGGWSLVGEGQLEGVWAEGRCRLQSPAGTQDVREMPFKLPASGTARYRVAAVATTGEGAGKKPLALCIAAELGRTGRRDGRRDVTGCPDAQR